MSDLLTRDELLTIAQAHPNTALKKVARHLAAIEQEREGAVDWKARATAAEARVRELEGAHHKCERGGVCEKCKERALEVDALETRITELTDALAESEKLSEHRRERNVLLIADSNDRDETLRQRIAQLEAALANTEKAYRCDISGMSARIAQLEGELGEAKAVGFRMGRDAALLLMREAEHRAQVTAQQIEDDSDRADGEAQQDEVAELHLVVAYISSMAKKATAIEPPGVEGNPIVDFMDNMSAEDKAAMDALVVEDLKEFGPGACNPEPPAQEPAAKQGHSFDDLAPLSGKPDIRCMACGIECVCWETSSRNCPAHQNGDDCPKKKPTPAPVAEDGVQESHVSIWSKWAYEHHASPNVAWDPVMDWEDIDETPGLKDKWRHIVSTIFAAGKAEGLEMAAREAERGAPNDMREPERIIAARIRALQRTPS